MTRRKDSGVIRLVLLAVLLTLVAAGFFLWKRPGIGSKSIDVGPVSTGVATLIETANERLSNAWTTGKVKTALVLSKRVPAGDVDVESRGGRVTLTGTVPTPRAKAAALSLTADIAGVQQVIDRLSIASPSASTDSGAMSRRVADLEIQVRVYEELLGDDVIHAENIRVHVEDGVVTLTGTVPRELDQRYAEAIAGSVAGVESVVTELVVARDSGPPT
jgi:hyperosmotically inducible periplasmic protein